MNKTKQVSELDSQSEPQQYDRYETRQERREMRRAGRNPWIIGVILIILGVVFLLQNVASLTLINNWWAVFILIPAVGAFGNAWRTYQGAGGHLTAQTRSSLIGGLILTLVAAVFLFNLNWAILGPVLIILVGIGLFINAALPS
jgi:hypothetical protein